MTRSPEIAIIGGTGLAKLEGIEILESKWPTTRFGETSSPLIYGRSGSREIVFIPRHGEDHHIPPHKINYRANLYALKQAGVKRVVAVNAVGGITSKMAPQELCVPDQIIDYTWGREHTFSDGSEGQVNHIDFTMPYHPSVRARLIEAAEAINMPLVRNGVYAATQGPRLESSAEIVRLERDGCDIVGMTGMPEAGLARELGLEYASLALVVNWAAGKSDEPLTLSALQVHLDAGMIKVRKLLRQVISIL